MKKIFVFLFLGCLHIHAKAQFELEYIHAAGVGIYFSDLANFPTIQYSPRLNILQFDSRSTLSLDARISGGYAIQSGSYAQDAFPVFYVPATLNYNNGSCATRTTDEYIGFYVGGGYGYQNAIDNYVVQGPIINAGLRFYLGREPFDFNMSYQFDITEQKSPIFGIGFHYILNMLK